MKRQEAIDNIAQVVTLYCLSENPSIDIKSDKFNTIINRTIQIYTEAHEKISKHGHMEMFND